MENKSGNNKTKKLPKYRMPFKPRIIKSKYNPAISIFLFVLFSFLAYYLFIYIDIDKILITAIITLMGISIEIFGNIFSYILTFIQSIPHIGPIIAKVITWPIFITLNTVAYFVSLIVIRFKGIAMVKDARILTTIFLIGILFGFILGRLF